MVVAGEVPCQIEGLLARFDTFNETRKRAVSQMRLIQNHDGGSDVINL